MARSSSCRAPTSHTTTYGCGCGERIRQILSGKGSKTLLMSYMPRAERVVPSGPRLRFMPIWQGVQRLSQPFGAVWSMRLDTKAFGLLQKQKLHAGLCSWRVANSVGEGEVASIVLSDLSSAASSMLERLTKPLLPGSADKMLNVSLIGFGAIGSGVAELLRNDVELNI